MRMPSIDLLFVDHQEDRRVRYSIKQSSISTEVSSLSFEMKTRWQHHYESASIRHHKSLNTSRANNTRLTILLLFVSCSFLILTLPIVVLNLIISSQAKPGSSVLKNNPLYSISSERNQPETILYYTLTRLLMIMNHSINFILYLLLGKRFRRDLKQLFINYWRQLYRQQRRRRRRRRQSSTQIREH
jgi:hypothetical protein